MSGLYVQVGVVAIERQRRLAILQRELFKSFDDHLLRGGLVHLLHAGCGCIWPCVAGNFLAPCRLHGLCMLCGNDNGVDFQRLYGAIGLL